MDVCNVHGMPRLRVHRTGYLSAASRVLQVCLSAAAVVFCRVAWALRRLPVGFVRVDVRGSGCGCLAQLARRRVHALQRCDLPQEGALCLRAAAA